MTISKRTSWSGLLAEGTAIVASILLAFAIQAWWERSNEAEEQRRILTAILTELRSNIENIDSELEYRRAALANIQRIFDVSSGRATAEPGEEIQLLANLNWWGKVAFATGALDSLIQGGRLQIIENEGLRFRLASLPDKYEYAEALERQTYESFRNVVAPYLIANTYFPEIANLWSAGRPGDSITNMKPIENVRGVDFDYAQFINNEELHGILTLRWADHLDAVDGYDHIRSSLSNTIALLEYEISQ